MVKGRDCRTGLNTNTDRLHCYGNTSATLRIYEVPWLDVSPVPRDCLCGTDSEMLPFTYVSTSQIVELRFDVREMSPSDDFDMLFFEGSWKVVRMPGCTKKLRKNAPNGVISFYSQSKSAEEVSRLKLILFSTQKKTHKQSNNERTETVTSFCYRNKSWKPWRGDGEIFKFHGSFTSMRFFPLRIVKFKVKITCSVFLRGFYFPVRVPREIIRRGSDLQA